MESRGLAILSGVTEVNVDSTSVDKELGAPTLERRLGLHRRLESFSHGDEAG